MNDSPHDPREPEPRGESPMTSAEDVKLPAVLALDHDGMRIATRAASPEKFEQAARVLDETGDRPELAAELRRLAAIALKRPVVTCYHARPDRAAHQTAVHVTRAILDGADLKTAHEAATGGRSCPACVAVAGISLGITIVSTVRGDKTFTSEQSRQVMLAALDAAQAELDAASN